MGSYGAIRYESLAARMKKLAALSFDAFAVECTDFAIFCRHGERFSGDDEASIERLDGVSVAEGLIWD